MYISADDPGGSWHFLHTEGTCMSGLKNRFRIGAIMLAALLLLCAAATAATSYPFTTLNPVVGVVEYPDFERILVADIPGLIEGAHENVGLGHAFLRHIERTSVLSYVLDMGGVDGRDPLDDLDALKNELELYMPGLSKRASMVIANKMDLEGAEENLERLREKLASEVIAIYPVTAALGELGNAVNGLREQVTAAKKASLYNIQ